MPTKLTLVNRRWALGEALSPSGEARCHRARDARSGRAAVLKVVSPRDAAARARLILEFERLAALDHPGLPEVFELGEVVDEGPLPAGAVFLAMELLDGEAALDACRAAGTDELGRRVAAILADALDALDALHRAGLVHHDVKPAHLVAAPDGRFRLIDLGLVRTGDGGNGAFGGTLPYLSPEALCGASEPAVDLYALGVTGYQLLAGRVPYAASDPAALLAAMAAPLPPPPGPAALIGVLAQLMALEPGARPRSATAVAAELARAGLLDEPRARRARGDGHAPGRPGFVASPGGRGAVLAALEAAPAAVVALVGPPGSGRTRLVEELDRRRALAALRAGRARPLLLGPTIADAARELDLGAALTAADAAPAEASARSRAAFLSRLLDATAARGATLHLRAPGRGLREAFASLRGAPGARVIVELDVADADAWTAALDGGLVRVDVPELDDAEIAALCERVAGRLAPAIARTAGRLARGRPRELVHLLAAAAARGPLTTASLRALRIEALDDELVGLIASLPAPATTILAALALLERAAGADELERAVDGPIGPALGALQSARLVEWAGTRIASQSDAIGRAALARLPAGERLALGERLLGAADLAGEHLMAARLARAIGRADAPARAAAAIAAIASGEVAAVVDDELLALGETIPGTRGARLVGELLLRAGRYDRAAARLATIADDPEAAVAHARALRLDGRPREAEQVLAGPSALDNLVGMAARTLLGRLRLDRGDARAALAALGAAPSGGSARHAERAEVAGLAALGLGDVAAARVAFGRLAELVAGAPPERRARARSLLGMAAQAAGALEDAAACYEDALALAEEAGDLHGAAIYAQNLGGTRRELGEHARALAPLERAAAVLGRVGRADEEALALFNLGNLQLSLGDVDAAQAAAERALARAPSGPSSFWAELLCADVERRRGLADAALRRCDRLGRRALDATAQLLLEAARAEAAVEADRPRVARAAAARLAVLRAAPSAPPDVAAHAALAEARVRLDLDETALPDALAAALRDAFEDAARGGRRDRGFRVAVALARDAIRRADATSARACLADAHRLHQEIEMRTPELRRAALADEPDARRLRALVDANAPTDGGAATRRLLDINKRLNSELDLDRLLELILDAVLELTRAERGFLLLRGDGGALDVRIERNVEADVRAGAAAFSRSIAERASSLGEPIVTVDAAGDARFEAALSVTDMKLRSVLAVPLAVKGRAVGCVYVDHRARVGLFRPADVALVVDLAEQAAIAVENARLLAENRRQKEEVRALAAALEEKLASQTVELEGMQREVREARRHLGVRYDYSGLVGRTPRMLELFRLLDRVTDTALPVVIYGESGTGKELVARALHYNGPRRKAAFVSESCGAIPETLLEAALFGHVRGAFTGAQGERRGLFEIADHGTLFLDEVGEMSPAMQVRLLRVLQEGEFRRVGGEKVLKVDVRVVVASNRDLSRLVEEGRFREDLFYRLNVVRVALPPLRERAADIPLLVQHFLAAHPGRGITRRALDRLAGYRWPGNVRQLENEIARATSLADGAIDVGDLSPAVQAGTDEAAVLGDERLDLHARVERLERALLEEALARTAGNQSEAARLLGLSRFGLQKKLRRYHLKARRGAATP